MAETEAKHTSLTDSQPSQSLAAPQSLLSPAAMLRHLRTPLYANAYYLMARTVALSVSGFFFWTVAARLYQPAEVGLGSALIAATSLLAGISNLGLGTGLIRFLPKADDPWRMAASCIAISGTLSVLSAALFVSGVALWSPNLSFVSEQPALSVCFVAFTAGATLSASVDSIFIAQRRARYAFLKGLAVGFGRILPLVGLALFAGALGIFAAGGLVTLLVVGVALCWVWRGSRRGAYPGKRLGRGLLAELMGFSFANYVGGLIYTLPSMLLPLLVLNVLGPVANGHFYISWMVGGLLSIVPMAISSSLFAEGSHFKSHLRGDAIRAVKVSLALVLPGVAVAFLVADKLLLLFGRAYSEAGVGLLRILALAAVPIILNSMYFTVKRVQKRMSSVVALSAVIAAGTLGLSYLLMPRVGLSGVGIAWLASQAAGAAIVSFSLRRRWGMVFASVRRGPSLVEEYGRRGAEGD